jgi:hypothetical protein
MCVDCRVGKANVGLVDERGVSIRLYTPKYVKDVSESRRVRVKEKSHQCEI